MIKINLSRDVYFSLAPLENLGYNYSNMKAINANTSCIETAIAGLLKKTGQDLAVAESCTGGLISHRITNVPGSSGYFKYGIVAYSNKIKTSRLEVPPKTLKGHGAVSRATALAMARNVRRIASTGIGLGITGIAGPTGATKGKPVGLTFIALSSDKKEAVRKFLFRGARDEIKFLASQAALDLLRRHLLAQNK